METGARYALIGAFMLAVIAASFAFVYWLENKGGFGERSYYRLRFENSVSGLQTGSVAGLLNGFGNSPEDEPVHHAGRPGLDGSAGLLRRTKAKPVLAVIVDMHLGRDLLGLQFEIVLHSGHDV